LSGRKLESARRAHVILMTISKKNVIKGREWMRKIS
jgi:hypothetical protein